MICTDCNGPADAMIDTGPICDECEHDRAVQAKPAPVKRDGMMAFVLWLLQGRNHEDFRRRPKA